MATITAPKTSSAATYTAQVDWYGAIDEINFYVENPGLINLEILKKNTDGSWLISLKFRSYTNLAIFLVSKLGVLLSDVESYLVPSSI